ncbi:MAG: Fic family protein [Chloroflexota bacterium]
MRWNWQQPDWPTFRYDSAVLQPFESQLLHRSGILLGTLHHLDAKDKQTLTIDLISNEAIKTSEIEGEYLNRASVQSSIRQQFGLNTDTRGISPAEQGIAEMMTNLYHTFAEPLTHERLYRWHSMLMNQRLGVQDIGLYRSHPEPMRVISRRGDRVIVHFEAPPSAQVQNEMDRFLSWFNQPNPEPALIRAGIAHLYFACVHPFEDGNGRIGRAIAEKALAQSLGQPTLLALAHTIESEKNAYYEALAQANQQLDITEWLVYFAHTILAAQQYTQQQVEFLIAKTKLYDRLRGQLNPRQEKLLARMFREGVDGFRGGLSATNYIRITKTSRATATRDLQDLVSKGALYREGERKHTRYYLNLG